MVKTKIIKVGQSLGVELPEEVLKTLRAGLGDSVTLTITDGGLLLSAGDPGLVRQLEAGRRVMQKRDAVLRELAK